MNRLFKCLLFVVLIFMSHHDVTHANTEEEPAQDDTILDSVSLDGIESFWSELNEKYQGFLPDLEKSSLYEFIKNKENFSFKNIVTGLLSYLFHELLLNGKLLGTLIVLTLFSSILQTMHSAFEESAVSKIAYFVVYLVLLFIVMNSFYSAFTYTKEAIDSMGGFMMALLPILFGLLASFGNIMSVAFFHPVVVFIIFSSNILISKFILPLFFISALLLIVSNLNEKYQVKHFANLLKSIALWTLGAYLTIFLGALSLQGAASAVQDGVAMKTTKFVTGNFIPVIGRTLTDATDTIFSASLLLKNAVGIVGVAIVTFIALFPVVKIMAIAIIYKLAASVLQPIGDGPIIDTLNSISTYMVYILASLLVVTLMFFLAIVIMVVASNVTIFLR